MNDYIVSTWQLVALVIIPFLFGLLWGIHITERKLLLKTIKRLSDDDIKEMVKENDNPTS